MNDESLIKSYVWHGDKCFFVSTIDRDSSSQLGPDRFAETIVWELDWKTAQRGDMLYQDGTGRGSINVHLAVCKLIHDTGKCEVPDGD